MTAYYKLSGAGNDFIALVEPSDPPAAEDIRAWCRRGLSLGADGLFTLERTSGGGRMIHHNPDGGRSDLCLNGCRCAARLAFHLGWDLDGELELKTDVGPLHARLLGSSRVALDLPALAGEPRAVTLDAGGSSHAGWTLRVGVPHLVIPWPAPLSTAPVGELGPALRSHPDLGPAGANVNFVRYAEPHHYELRTFERGVEAETLACGTGVVATAVAGLAAGRLRLPATALTAGGFELEIGGDLEAGRLRRILLTGDARILGRGEIFPAAAAVPEPPAWR